MFMISLRLIFPTAMQSLRRRLPLGYLFVFFFGAAFFD
jgi:hypothetical protein